MRTEVLIGLGGGAQLTLESLPDREAFSVEIILTAQPARSRRLETVRRHIAATIHSVLHSGGV